MSEVLDSESETEYVETSVSLFPLAAPKTKPTPFATPTFPPPNFIHVGLTGHIGPLAPNLLGGTRLVPIAGRGYRGILSLENCRSTPKRGQDHAEVASNNTKRSRPSSISHSKSLLGSQPS